MLAAVVLASLWAQAEPAPPPPPPPPPPEEPPPVLANALGIVGQLATRTRTGEPTLSPATGFSIGGNFEHRLLELGGGAELGAGMDFFYDRFADSGPGAAVPGVQPPGSNVLSDTSFALLATLAWRAGTIRPFAAVGGGVAVGYFSTSDSPLNQVSTTAVQPLARMGGGIEAALSRTFAFVARFDYTLAFTRPPTTTATGMSYSLFGDVVHVGVGVAARF